MASSHGSLTVRPAQQIHVNAGLVRRDTILRQCVSTDSAASNHDAVVVPIDVCVIGSVPSPPRHLLMRRLGRGAQVFYFHSFVAAENCPCYRAQGITRVGSADVSRVGVVPWRSCSRRSPPCACTCGRMAARSLSRDRTPRRLLEFLHTEVHKTFRYDECGRVVGPGGPLCVPTGIPRGRPPCPHYDRRPSKILADLSLSHQSWRRCLLSQGRTLVLAVHAEPPRLPHDHSPAKSSSPRQGKIQVSGASPPAVQLLLCRRRRRHPRTVALMTWCWTLQF